jgi:hypothetical protein
MSEGTHDDLLAEAIVADGDAYRALYADRIADAHASFESAAVLYRASWEAAPPRSFGRLVAYVKSATLAGEPDDAAAYVREALGGGCDSPTSCYALAIAALIEDDDATAARAAVAMTEGDAAFLRAAEALAALAARDRGGYARAVAAIIADFEGREQHLTGVAVADTALLMEALAERRDMAVRPPSELLPDTV